MVTEKLWKSMYLISRLVPRHLFIFDKDKKTFRKVHHKLINPWLCAYLFYGLANGLPLLLNIIYRIKYLQLSHTFLAIHILMLSIIVFATSLGFICIYTFFGNDDYFYVLFDTIMRFQVKAFGKK